MSLFIPCNCLCPHVYFDINIATLAFFFFFFNLFIDWLIFLAVLGLRFCARAFSSCGEQGPLLIAVRRPLTITASPVAEHKLQTRRLWLMGPVAPRHVGTWDPPRPGLEPVSPALAGRLSTTAPPGKPLAFFWLVFTWYIFFCLFTFFWLRWVFIAVRGLFSSCGKRGLLFVVDHGL